jgi:HK97 family phage prohead protease
MTKMNPKSDLEFRMSDLAAVKDDDLLVEGYAAVYDEPSVICNIDGTDYKEVMRRGCIDAKTDLTDVVMRYNHYDNDMIVARTTNGTLSLSIDDKGLKFSARLAPTTQGKDLYTLVQRKDVTKMSFAFLVDDDSYDYDNHTRNINHIALIKDVSAVDFPAYNSTSLEVIKRSFADMEKEIKDRAEAEERRKRLYLLTFC